MEEVPEGRQRKPWRSPEVAIGTFFDFSPPKIGRKVFVHTMGREVCVAAYSQGVCFNERQLNPRSAAAFETDQVRT